MHMNSLQIFLLFGIVHIIANGYIIWNNVDAHNAVIVRLIFMVCQSYLHSCMAVSKWFYGTSRNIYKCKMITDQFLQIACYCIMSILCFSFISYYFGYRYELDPSFIINSYVEWGSMYHVILSTVFLIFSYICYCM